MDPVTIGLIWTGGLTLAGIISHLTKTKADDEIVEKLGKVGPAQVVNIASAATAVVLSLGLFRPKQELSPAAAAAKAKRKEAKRTAKLIIKQTKTLAKKNAKEEN